MNIKAYFFLLGCLSYSVGLVGLVDDAPPGATEQVFLDNLEQMSDAEIEALLAQEGIDGQEVASVVREELKALIDQPQTRLPAGMMVSSAAQQPAPSVTLSDLIAREQSKSGEDDSFLRHYLTFYSSPDFASIPAPKPVIEEVYTKLLDFIETKVRGQRLETVAMVAFIVYRQLSWFYLQYIKEQLDEKGLSGRAYDYSYAESFLGLLGFNSRALAYTDLFIRVSVCSMRLYLDLSSWMKEFKEGMFFADPDGFLRLFKNHLHRAQFMFKNHDYYGIHLSLIKKVVLGLALPFTWAGLFSKKSPGAPFQNPIFQSALSGFSRQLSYEAGWNTQQRFELTVPQPLQKKLFNKSGGLIRERLFVDMSQWVGRYVGRRYAYNEDIKASTYFGRKVGKYALRHVYLHVLINMIRSATRHGALQATGWVSQKLGLLLTKIGFFSENPTDASRRWLHRACVSNGLIEEGQSLEEVLVYPAAIFPGAFARAVRTVITKQKLAPVLARSKAFIAHLNAMHGISPYDLLRMMSINPMAPQQMSSHVTSVKSAVSSEDWQKILTAFLNELVIEIFFDRQRIICQVITEPLLSLASKSVLHSLYGEFLPKKKK